MGLDSYFVARKYQYKSFGEWDKKAGRKDQAKYPKALKVFEDEIFNRNFKSVAIQEDYQIGYFRKFNALHSYIVKHIAKGIDKCQDIRINKAKAEEILNILKQVSEDHSKAEKLLPTRSGFFFGSTDYDEWYFNDIEEAVKLFESILKNLDFDKYDLIYQASW